MENKEFAEAIYRSEPDDIYRDYYIVINDRRAIYIHPPSDLLLLRFVTRGRGRKLTLRVTWLGLIPETGNHNPLLRNSTRERNVNQLRVRRYALWPGKFCQASLIAASVDLRNFRRGQRGSSSNSSGSISAVVVVAPPLSASSRYADLCHVIPPPPPRVSCPSAIKFFSFETNNERLSNIDPDLTNLTDSLRIIETKRRGESGLRQMDENSIALFRLRFTKRDEPFFRPNLGGNWCQFPTTRWKDIELWEKVTVYFLRGRKHVRKRSTGLINREVLLPRIIVDYKR